MRNDPVFTPPRPPPPYFGRSGGISPESHVHHTSTPTPTTSTHVHPLLKPVTWTFKGVVDVVDVKRGRSLRIGLCGRGELDGR